MGLQPEGAFGGFVNKTGPLVGRFLKGQNVITALPRVSKKPPTPAQIDVRNKFKLLTSWLSWISPLIHVGWKDSHEEKQSPMNAAVRYHYYEALSGSSPNFTINYSKVLFSRGKLSEAASTEVATSVPMEVTFSWAAYLNTGLGGPTDLATVMLYNVDKQKFVFLTAAAARSALSYDLALPAEFSGDEAQCWISFVSANGKKLSNSTYIGMVTIL